MQSADPSPTMAGCQGISAAFAVFASPSFKPNRHAGLMGRAQAEAAKWAEGGEYRVALHTAAGALGGGVGGALGAGASAALMPRIGEAIDGIGLPTPVAQALGAVTAAAIGGIAGGAAGAASAYSVDLNNRQLHSSERERLRQEAKQVAREQQTNFDSLTPEQQAKVEKYWYDQLSQAALARVDDQGKKQRDDYLAAVGGTSQLPYQGYFSAQQAISDAAVADRVVNALAAENKPITNMYGDTVLSGGQPLTAFNATEEQRANSYLLNTPTAQAERQQIANRNQATLNYLGAINGGATRDYTLEEVVLGGAIGGRAVDAFASALERVAASRAVAAGESAGKNPLLADAIARDGDRLVLNQGNVPTCGHNACGMVLDTLGKPVDVGSLVEKIPPQLTGIRSNEVAALFRSEGVDAAAFGNRTVSDLARYTQDGTPVVVRITDVSGGTNFSHFVVVDGVTTRGGVEVVAIRDSQLGTQYFSPVNTFSRNFTGEVILPRKP